MFSAPLALIIVLLALALALFIGPIPITKIFLRLIQANGDHRGESMPDYKDNASKPILLQDAWQ
jgi:hypothetical protein